MKPVLFVDDDQSKQGLEIYGVKVVGGIEQIPDFVKDNDIEKIVIAIPSMGKQQMAEVNEAMYRYGCPNTKDSTHRRLNDRESIRQRYARCEN